MIKLNINLTEEFPHLASAPIVEAVIDVRAKSQVELNEEIVRSFIDANLKGYRFAESQLEFSHQITFGADIPTQQTTINAWKGVRFLSEDEKTICQYNKDGFVCSKLAPYSDWQTFSEEGLSLWRFYQDMANPSEVSRLGLRFINRIVLPVGDNNFKNYIDPAPQTPIGLDVPFYGFLYQETLAVPGYPYAINLIRTIQPPTDKEGCSVIIDIDVFTTDGVELEIGKIKTMLNEMCWLKNKAFFGSITQHALEILKCYSN